MSEENVIDENLEVEELPAEDKKKAINLQDLVYIKRYIDSNHYSKSETDEIIDEEVAKQVSVHGYSKTEADNAFYKKTDANNTFYKKTDIVARATNANNAEKANSLLDKQSNTYKEVHIMTEAEYEATTVNSNGLYFIKES